MATTYKVLGQVAPTVGTWSLLYTAPSTSTAIASTITVCNQSTTAGTYSIAVLVNTGTNTTYTPSNVKQYITYSATIDPLTTTSFTLGLALDAYDQIVVLSGTTGTVLSFNGFGLEVA